MKLPIPSQLSANKNVFEQIKDLTRYLTLLVNALQPYIDRLDEEQRKR